MERGMEGGLSIPEREIHVEEGFDLSQERTIGDYVVTRMIGSGSFAVVWRGKHKLTDMEVAIKEISLVKLSRKLKESLESEVSVLKIARHSNIIRLMEIIKAPHRIYLVLEYCSGGDLSEYIKRKGKLEENVARRFMCHLGAGLQVLRSQNLIHRDLKPQNLLLSTNDDNAILKIADFGFARSLQPQGMADTLCGSPLYMAPEILFCQKYDAKADLWSVGIILYEMLTGKAPFSGINHVQLLRNIERSDVVFPDPLSYLLSPSCIDICKKLLKKNPMERISFKEYFQHPFLNTNAANILSPKIQHRPQNSVEDEDYPFAIDIDFPIPSLPLSIKDSKNDQVGNTVDSECNQMKEKVEMEKELFQKNINSKDEELSSSFESDYVVLHESAMKTMRLGDFKNNTHSTPRWNLFLRNPIRYLNSKRKEIKTECNVFDVVGLGESKFTKVETCNDLKVEDKKEDHDSLLSTLLFLLDVSTSLITKIAEEKMKMNLPLHASSLHLICLSILQAGIKLSGILKQDCSISFASPSKIFDDTQISKLSTQSILEIRNAFQPILEHLELDKSTKPYFFQQAYIARLKFVNEHILKRIDPSQKNLPYGFDLLYDKAIQLARSGGVDEVLGNIKKKKKSCMLSSFLLKFLLYLAPLLPRSPPFLLAKHDFDRLKRYSDEVDRRLQFSCKMDASSK